MTTNNRRRLGIGAGFDNPRAEAKPDHSKLSFNPQLMVATSGGLLDHDAAADALAWGKRLEVEVGFWLQRRRRS